LIKNDIVIHPNPTNDIIHVNSELKLLGYVIMDINGKKLAKGSINDDRTISFRGLASGIYLLLLEDATGSVKIERIIKY
jgi:hypothetical protein